MKLSAFIPVHNEEKNLDDCLKSVAFADEIVVLLDKCTDSSKEIALRHNAKIVEGSWPTESMRRLVGVEACTGDWIIDLDADERVPTELATEIRHTVNTSPFDLHPVPFDNYIGNKLVKYGWGAYIGVSQKVALYRKGAKSYTTRGITHGEAIINGRYGPALQNAITHYLDDDLSDTFRRFDRYTTTRAKELIEQNDRDGFGRNFIRFFSRFYKCYIRRQGYKEGSIGFLIATLAGLYPIVSYIKAKYKI
jgi:glycosyltransferase involved in cell wall biosynthesis